MIIFRRKEQPVVASNIRKLDAVVDKSSNVLFRAFTVFPFDFFPDEIIIDQYQLRIVKKRFFLSESIETILIKDVASINVQTAPLFATLEIKHSSPPTSIKINYLKKAEALEARRIIQGLKTILNEEIDISAIPSSQLIQRLEIIGSVHV